MPSRSAPSAAALSDTRRRHSCAASALLGLLCAGAAHGAPGTVASRDIEGVPLLIEVRGDLQAGRDGTAVEAAFAAASEAASRLLADHLGSEIDLLNKVPSRVRIELSPPTVAVLRRALAIAEETGGAYDPTLPPLLALWGVADREPRPLEQPLRAFEVEMALRRVDWEYIELDPAKPIASRTSRRSSIDLADAGRGAVVDAALASLRADGVSAARVSWDAAHAVYSGGREPWTLVLSGWRAGERAELDLREGGLAIVWPRRVRRGSDGRTIHERIDPRTGYPKEGVRAAVVTSLDSFTSGALAAALFAMGAEEGPAFVEAREGTEGMLVLDDRRWTSKGLAVRWPPLPSSKAE